MKTCLVLIIFNIINSYYAELTHNITEEKIVVNEGQVIVIVPELNINVNETTQPPNIGTSTTETTTNNLSSEEASTERTGEISTGTGRKLPTNESFTGGCPTGYDRADDGTCQELE